MCLLLSHDSTHLDALGRPMYSATFQVQNNSSDIFVDTFLLKKCYKAWALDPGSDL